jgi:hypothetical protein
MIAPEEGDGKNFIARQNGQKTQRNRAASITNSSIAP